MSNYFKQKGAVKHIRDDIYFVGSSTYVINGEEITSAPQIFSMSKHDIGWHSYICPEGELDQSIERIKADGYHIIAVMPPSWTRIEGQCIVYYEEKGCKD